MQRLTQSKLLLWAGGRQSTGIHPAEGRDLDIYSPVPAISHSSAERPLQGSVSSQALWLGAPCGQGKGSGGGRRHCG